MRAINTRPVTSSTGWQVDDKSMDGKSKQWDHQKGRHTQLLCIIDFLDSVIGGLVAAESTSEQKNLEK
jgi:hypothetical protein